MFLAAGMLAGDILNVNFFSLISEEKQEECSYRERERERDDCNL